MFLGETWDVFVTNMVCLFFKQRMFFAHYSQNKAKFESRTAVQSCAVIVADTKESALKFIVFAATAWLGNIFSLADLKKMPIGRIGQRKQKV